MFLTRKNHLGKNGVAAMEFALIFPIIVLMYFGTFEVTRLMRASMNLNRAAQTLADLVATRPAVIAGSLTPTSTNDLADMCKAANLTMAPFAAGVNAGFDYVAQTGGNITGWSDSTSCGAAVEVPQPTADAIKNQLAVNVNDSVVIVYATYKYTPIFGGLVNALGLSPHYTLSQIAYGRPRDAQHGPTCSANCNGPIS